MSVKGTLSDNARLSSNKEGDLYFGVTPSISLVNESSRLEFNATYAPTLTLYTSDLDRSRTFNVLSAYANWETIPDEFFLEGRASIQQSFVTPFGPTFADVGSDTSNQAETRTISLSPYLLGDISPETSYEARYRASSQTAGASEINDTTSQRFSAHIETFPNKVGWRLSYEKTLTDYTSRSDIRNDRSIATLSYRPDSRISFFGRTGYETNNYTAQNQSTVNYGAGFDWSPIPRTTLSGSWDRRYFGPAYDVKLTHRLKRSFVSFKGFRRAQNSSQSGLINQLDEFSTLGELLDETFRFSVPDDTQRANLIADLASRGLSLPQLFSLLSNQTVKVRGLEASAGINGVKRNIVFRVFREETNTIIEAEDLVVPIGSTISNNNIRTGGILSYLQNLTPRTTGNVTVSHTVTTSNIPGNDAKATQDVLSISATQSITARTKATIGVRYGKLDTNQPGGYVEHAVFGAFTHTF